VPDGRRIALRPSRLRRGLIGLGVPLALAALAVSAVQTGQGAPHPWPVLCGLVLVWIALRAARAPEPVALALREPELLLEDAGGRLTPVRRLGPVDVTGAALHCPVRDAGGRRRRLVVWRDSVDEADWRRLARAALADRWPGAED
jgi:hypothetical protein